jgi:hypothetical protein
MTKKTLTFDTPFDTYTSSAIIGEGDAGRDVCTSLRIALERSSPSNV